MLQSINIVIFTSLAVWDIPEGWHWACYMLSAQGVCIGPLCLVYVYSPRTFASPGRRMPLLTIVKLGKRDLFRRQRGACYCRGRDERLWIRHGSLGPSPHLAAGRRSAVSQRLHSFSMRERRRYWACRVDKGPVAQRPRQVNAILLAGHSSHYTNMF